MGPSLGAVAAGSGVVVASAYWTLMSPFSQLLGSFPFRGETDEKVLALTFDDGPNEPYTSQIADLLGNRGVSATFFQVGRCVERAPEVTIRLAREGHVIGNHSYSHRVSRCLTRRGLRVELQQAEQVFLRVLGRRPALYRPPWLLRVPALFPILAQRRLQPVSGSFGHVLEVLQPSPQRIAARAGAKARPGAILIFHDGYDAKHADRASTVLAVERVVNRLSQAGYRFTTVDRLLGVPAYVDDEG